MSTLAELEPEPSERILPAPQIAPSALRCGAWLPTEADLDDTHGTGPLADAAACVLAEEHAEEHYSPFMRGADAEEQLMQLTNDVPMVLMAAELWRAGVDHDRSLPRASAYLKLAEVAALAAR